MNKQKQSAMSVIDESICGLKASAYPGTAMELLRARELVKELILADIAYDIAKEAFADASRARGSFNPNPLGHGHPTVSAYLHAQERRTKALHAIQGLST